MFKNCLTNLKPPDLGFYLIYNPLFWYNRPLCSIMTFLTSLICWHVGSVRKDIEMKNILTVAQNLTQLTSSILFFSDIPFAPLLHLLCVLHLSLEGPLMWFDEDFSCLRSGNRPHDVENLWWLNYSGRRFLKLTLFW